MFLNNFTVSQAKLDSSFSSVQFFINNYEVRARRVKMGGIKMEK